MSKREIIPIYTLVIFTHDDDFLSLVRKSKLEHGGIILALIVPYYVALHLALAEKRNVDYFITCDDSIIKLYRKHQGIMKIKVVGLLEFIGLEVK